MDFLGKINGIKTVFQENPRVFWLGAAAVGIAVIALTAGAQILTAAGKKVAQVNQETSQETERNSLLENINRLGEQSEEYKRRLPPTSESAWLMNQLTKLAASAGLTLLSIQPEKLPPSEKMQGVAVRITLNCGYHQLGQLAAKIENSDIFMRIQELNLEKIATEETTQGGNVVRTGKGRVEMVVHSFLLSEK